MKALIVDDSKTFRRIIIKALASAGIKDTSEAEDGEAAVAAARNGEFDVLLLEWNLPKKSGIEALRELRAEGNTVPAIMVTTEAGRDHVIEAIKTGANEYLIKPFSAEQLAVKVRNVIATPAN